MSSLFIIPLEGVCCTLKSEMPRIRFTNRLDRHVECPQEIDDSGDFLVMGSMTGVLYVTANGGEIWKCVTAHLPYIYAVYVG